MAGSSFHGQNYPRFNSNIDYIAAYGNYYYQYMKMTNQCFSSVLPNGQGPHRL